MKNYKLSASILISFVLIFLIGYFTLMSSFGFPEVLRLESSERFIAFQKNQNITVFGYLLMSITAILQIFMAILIHNISKKGNIFDSLGLISGILAGVFQLFGFIRWILLIPMLSNALIKNEVNPEFIYFFEKFANTYLGMTIGEYLGTLFLAFWMIFISISHIKSQIFDKNLSYLGFFSGIMLFIASFEFLGSIFYFIEKYVLILWGFYFVWIVVLSIYLFISKTENRKVPILLWLFGVVFYLMNVIPALS